MKNKGLKFFFVFATAIFADCVSAMTIDNPFDPTPEQPVVPMDDLSHYAAEQERAYRQRDKDLNQAYTELSKTRKLPEPKKICSYNPYECSLSYGNVAQALLKEIACYLPKDKEQAESFINSNLFCLNFIVVKEARKLRLILF